jgi:hypothetical protein
MEELLTRFKYNVCRIVAELEMAGHFENSHTLGSRSRAILESIQEKSLPDSDWPPALYELTEIIYMLTKRKPVVLVDEYDTPTAYAAVNGDYFSQVWFLLLLEYDDALSMDFCRPPNFFGVFFRHC